MRWSNAILLFLLPMSASAQDRLLPALECSKKTPEQWMAEFTGDDGESAEPLWCLYWSDARNPEVLAFMEEWRAKVPDRRPMPQSTPPPRNVGREIEEILTQWNIPHDPLPPMWAHERDGEMLHELDDVLAFIVAMPEKRIDAGQVWYRVPTGLFPRPTALIDEPDSRLVERLGSSDAYELCCAAVTLVTRRHELDQAIKALVHAAAQDQARGSSGSENGSANTSDISYRASSHWEREPWSVQVFDARHLPRYTLEWATGVTGTVGAQVLVSMILGSDTEAEDVRRVQQIDPAGIVLRLPDDQYEALEEAWNQRRGHQRSNDRFGSSTGGRQAPLDPASFSFLTQIGDAPDPEGRRVRSDRVLRAGEALRLAIVRGSPIEPSLRSLLAELNVPYDLEGAIGPGDWYMHALDVIQTLRLSTPDVADACISVMLQDEHFSEHVEQCVSILEHCTLSLRQRALVVQMNERWVPEPHSAFFATLGPVAVERAARLRTYAQAWSDMNALRDLLKISRPHPQDLTMIAAALDRGFVNDRLTAIEILAEHPDLDSSDLHRALVAACDDVDEDVRSPAASVRAQRGW